MDNRFRRETSEGANTPVRSKAGFRLYSIHVKDSAAAPSNCVIVSHRFHRAREMYAIAKAGAISSFRYGVHFSGSEMTCSVHRRYHLSRLNTNTYRLNDISCSASSTIRSSGTGLESWRGQISSQQHRAGIWKETRPGYGSRRIVGRSKYQQCQRHFLSWSSNTN